MIPKYKFNIPHNKYDITKPIIHHPKKQIYPNKYQKLVPNEGGKKLSICNKFLQGAKIWWKEIVDLQ